VSNDDITKAEGYHFAAIGMDNTPENKNIKIAYFQKALKLSKQYKIIYAKVANSYAGYLSFGDVEAKELALKLFNESKEIKENLLVKDLPGLARTYGGLGRLALFSGDESKLKDALENFLEDLKVSIELNDNYGISNMYSFIGTTYKKMKEYDKAIEYYSKSIECDHNKIDIYASLLGILEIKISQNEDIKLSLDQIKKSKVIYGDIPPFLLNDIKNIADKNILEELLIINY
jgi:tetratricopeptide (TPR) repeat protein